jgi:hypothetical protein
MMNHSQQDQFGVGTIFGAEVAGHVDRHSAGYCIAERQRIETTNRPAILALRVRVGHLQEQERDLQRRLYQAPQPGEFRLRRRKAIVRYAIAALLTVAAFIFAVLSFDPYQLGWKAWVYCLGISIVTPFLVDRVLERWASPRLVNTVATVACAVAVLSLVLLGEIRGDLLAQQLKSTPSAVIQDADAPTPPPAENTFYDRTLGLLRLVMALLAFAIEIGAGVAFHEAGQWASETGEDPITLRRELAEVREEMVTHGHNILALEHAGVQFEHEFWRDFYRSFINGVKRGSLQKLIVITLAVGVLAHGQAPGAGLDDVVIALDLSQSVAVKGHDSRAEFQKNLDAVTQILAALPAGAQVNVIGITDASFATPYIILSGQLARDPGYFYERLANGRAALVGAWRERSARLAPRYPQTDILGALLVASEIFHEAPPGSRKVLVVLSDMKQSTKTLNIEHMPVVRTKAALQQVEDSQQLAALHSVQVYIEGVDGAGETVAYWKSLQQFWLAYFERSGATVVQYAVLRDVPKFADAHATEEAGGSGK